jgi:hypothetical protein
MRHGNMVAVIDYIKNFCNDKKRGISTGEE